MNMHKLIGADASSPSPGVSVVVTCYNHERYIEQAICSAIAQQTSFPVEILVADDCSTDGTAQVISRLNESHLVG